MSREPRVAVLLANGFEEIEAMTPVDVLRRAGCEVTTYAVGTTTCDVMGAHQINVTADAKVQDADAEMIDMLFLPGGMPGSVNLRDDATVIELVNNVFMKLKWVTAICAAPLVLQRAHVTDGMRVTAHPSVKEKIIKTSVYTQARVQKDQNVITGIGPGAALEFAMVLLRELGLSQKADELSAGMCLRD